AGKKKLAKVHEGHMNRHKAVMTSGHPAPDKKPDGGKIPIGGHGEHAAFFKKFHEYQVAHVRAKWEKKWKNAPPKLSLVRQQKENAARADAARKAPKTADASKIFAARHQDGVHGKDAKDVHAKLLKAGYKHLHTEKDKDGNRSHTYRKNNHGIMIVHSKDRKVNESASLKTHPLGGTKRGSAKSRFAGLGRAIKAGRDLSHHQLSHLGAPTKDVKACKGKLKRRKNVTEQVPEAEQAGRM
ncbi:MAG: hypothetical protein ABJA02_07735, partial [Acidobacteriota bacterium]